MTMRRLRPVTLAASAFVVSLLIACAPSWAGEIESRAGLLVVSSDAARRVDRAIVQARRFLLARQRDDGSWGNGGERDVDGGRTSLVLLALLSSGEPADSPAVQGALKYLRTITTRTTYGTSLRAAALSLLPERLRKLELQADLRWLLKAMIEKGPDRGMYTYDDAIEGAGDFSNSQYGVLGVWYAADAGLEVPATFWRDVDAAWKRGQLPDGSWGYTSSRSRGYASMTAAGAATLALTEEHLALPVDLARPRINQELERAVAWLGENFAVDRNVGLDSPARGFRGGTWLHYLLFGYERVGEITGFARFGEHRWFERGAEQLVRTQRGDGGWNAGMGPDVDAAYALLFLARGGAPVALQKLQFDGRWNNRPLDARRMSRWLRRGFERLVNWQVVSADAPLDEWRESPILYIASDRALRLNDDQKGKLRAYVEQGGLVLAVNEGPRDDFARSVQALVGELFSPHELRDLPPGHPLLKGNFDASGFHGKVQAVSNGVRELLVLVRGGDVTARWHGNVVGPRATDNPFSLVGNLWFSVTDGDQVLRKLERTWIERDPAARPQRALALARLKFQGNWNPEPAGWTRLSNLLANEGVLELHVESCPIDATLVPDRFPVAHLSSAGEFALEAGELRELKRYLDAGGLLVCDAAGGGTDAAVSIERMLARLYPDAPLVRAAPDDPLLRGIDAVSYRRHAAETLRLGTSSRLKALRVNGRVVAVVSGEDLSAGLVGYPRDRIVGYTPASAARVVRQVLLHVVDSPR